MISIAICDDDVEFSKNLEEKYLPISQTRQNPVRSLLFLPGKNC